jgi:hypothetical protein
MLRFGINVCYVPLADVHYHFKLLGRWCASTPLNLRCGDNAGNLAIVDTKFIAAGAAN